MAEVNISRQVLPGGEGENKIKGQAFLGINNLLSLFPRLMWITLAVKSSFLFQCLEP